VAKAKSMADTKTQWILDLKDNMSSGIEHIDKELSQLRKDFKQFETNVDSLDAGGIPEVKNETKELGEVFTEASGSFSEMLGGLVTGDYASVTSGFQGITSGITAMRTASLAFIATPIGAAIAALAGIGLAVGAWANYNREAYKTNQIISQITQSEGELTSQIRTRALALQETFGGEWRENVEAAKSLAKSFGISYEEAFDTVEYGLIRGGNVNKEFMDSIREYPKLFEEGGFSAKDFIKTINAGYDLSIYQDKLPDAFKEFGLSVKEQTTASKAALENAFGKTFTNELFTGIKEGSITTREALLQISNQTEKTSLNAQQQAQLTADLFRGAGEDAGGFVEIMKAANVALGDTEQALTATQKHFGAMSELNQELEEAKANALESDGFMAFSANMEQLWTNIKIGWYNVVGFFTNGFSEITKHITSFIATFVQSFTILPMKAKEIFTNVLKEIGDVVSKIMEGANILKTLREDGVGAAWEAGKNWISGIAKEVGDIKKAAVDGAKDIGNTLGKAYMTNYKIANENEESKADAFRLQEDQKNKEGSGGVVTDTGSGVIPGLSGPGNGGGGKILNMELNITNHFNAANKSKMDIRQMADEIVGVVVDRLRDSSIAFG
jgi:hypothetical protein